jgi:hypothetical protein
VAELITQRGVYNILAFSAAERLRSTRRLTRTGTVAAIL